LKFLTSAAVAALCVSTALGTSAVAGECPADQVLTMPREIENAPDIGIKRPILAAVPLKGWRGLGDMSLRMRQLTVLPGGVVPTHPHKDRPTIIYIVSGEIWENNTYCAVPILREAGDWLPEFGEFYSSWWENKSDQPVVIISTDVVPWIDTPHYESSAGVKPEDIAIRDQDM
jgi:hypothetical protein